MLHAIDAKLEIKSKEGECTILLRNQDYLFKEEFFETCVVS